MPAACTRTRRWPGPGTGSGCSAHSSAPSTMVAERISPMGGASGSVPAEQTAPVGTPLGATASHLAHQRQTEHGTDHEARHHDVDEPGVAGEEPEAHLHRLGVL